METARLLSKEYLNEKGNYYRGLDIWDVNINYCQTGGFSWSQNINSIGNDLVKKANS